jgi:hypothetical protein
VLRNKVYATKPTTWASDDQSVDELRKATISFVMSACPSFRIPVAGEILLPRPDWSWGPPSLLYKGYQFSYTVANRPGREVNHLPSSSAEVKERLELYLYSTSRPIGVVLG